MRHYRLKAKSYNPKANLRGQVIILSVLAIGGAILSVTAIAGLLTLYELRQSTNFENSTRAILAADAGVEWSLYQFFKVSESDAIQFASPTGYTIGLSNGSDVVVNCFGLDPNQNPMEQAMGTCYNASSVQAVGTAAGASRAFRTYFQLLR